MRLTFDVSDGGGAKQNVLLALMVLGSEHAVQRPSKSEYIRQSAI